MHTISTAYIRSPLADWFWFILLPPIAVVVALVSETWLTFVALASINLWITVPHHFGTWCRTYGLREDWQRFRSRVIVGPILIIAAVLTGFVWAPLTIFLVTLLWDHQHSVMQQHGLARIYDFKAGAGGPNSGKLDLWLNVVLFVNHLLTVPLWTEIWVQQLYAWRLPIESTTVFLIQAASYSMTAVYLVYYVIQVSRGVAAGNQLNPVKYAFLGSSYALWYYAGWHTNSILVYGIAHRIMHGLQYLVIVYWFLERKQATSGTKPWMLPKLSVATFAAIGLVYAVLFQLLLLRPLSYFGFGVIGSPSPPSQYGISGAASYELYAATIIASTALVHYYFDSFIWKIRDEKRSKVSKTSKPRSTASAELPVGPRSLNVYPKWLKDYRFLAIVLGLALPLGVYEALSSGLPRSSGEVREEWLMDPNSNLARTLVDVYPNRSQGYLLRAYQAGMCWEQDFQPAVCEPFPYKDLRDVRQALEEAIARGGAGDQEQLYHFYAFTLVQLNEYPELVEQAVQAWRRNFPYSTKPDPRDLPRAFQ